MTDETRDFLCEVCGKTATMTDKEAFQDGWDYPPFMGVSGVVSPRTCGDCGIDKTAWWAIMVDHKTTVDDLPEKHRITVKRILAEKS
jgi:hypothetical protein